MGIPAQGKIESCASCGKPGAGRLVTGLEDAILCESCIGRVRAGEATSYWAHTEPEPDPPPEERFEELFRAARVLLNEGIEEEDQIFPTLALANELGQGVAHLLGVQSLFRRLVEDEGAWAAESDRFVRRYGSLRPLRVAGGVLVLERLPVSVEVRGDPEEGVPLEAIISVYAHRRPAKPEHVASLYEKVLSAARIQHDESRTGHMGFDFYGRSLAITKKNGSIMEPRKGPGIAWQGKAKPFPHPRMVQEFYRMLLGTSSGDGFIRHLATRRRGGPPFPDNLIPACVAFYLRKYGDIGSPET